MTAPGQAGDVRYAFADGQLCRLYCDRPDAAYPLAEAPTDFLRAYCAWQDANGDYADMDRDALLTVVLDWYQGDLSAELQMYCDSYGLPQLSADDLRLQISGDPLAVQHVAWLKDFEARWDEMTDLYYVVTRG